MSHTCKTKDSSAELTISVSQEDYKPQLKKAAERISKSKKIKGFRPGKAPYEVVVREVGEMTILQEAIESIVHEAYYKAVIEEKLETVGAPKIDLKKLAPGNEVEFTATVALLPNVQLADATKLGVEQKEGTLADDEVQKSIDALRGMHAKEVLKDGPATGTDKLVLDLNMAIDKVPVDGGQAKDYAVYLGEDHYIPGFNKEVEGLKKGDEKEFSLSFPETHYQKTLAGKTVMCTVNVKDVFERQLPDFDNAFAKNLGQESAEKLRSLVTENMQREADAKANQQTEIALLDAMVEKSTFDAIPDILIDSERQKMFYELKRDLEKNGVEIAQYLADIKKKEEDLYEEFRVQAEKRAKAALLSRQVALENDLKVEDDEVDAELATIQEMYKHNKEYTDNLKKPEVRDTIAVQIQNKKVMQWLKAKAFGKALVEDEKLADKAHKNCEEDHDHGAHEKTKKEA